MLSPENYSRPGRLEEEQIKAIKAAYGRLGPDEKEVIDRASSKLISLTGIGKVSALEILAKVGMFLDGIAVPTSPPDIEQT